MKNLTTKQFTGAVVNDILNKMRFSDEPDPGTNLPPIDTVVAGATSGSERGEPIVGSLIRIEPNNCSSSSRCTSHSRVVPRKAQEAENN